MISKTLMVWSGWCLVSVRSNVKKMGLRYQPPTPTRPHDMTVQTPSVGIRTHSTPGRRRATQTGRWKRKIEKNKSTRGDVRNRGKRRRKINENRTRCALHLPAIGWIMHPVICTSEPSACIRRLALTEPRQKQNFSHTKSASVAIEYTPLSPAPRP